MNQSTLASAYAAAQPKSQPEARSLQPTALSAEALLSAVRRSLQSCQDVSTYRMLLLNLSTAAEDGALSRSQRSV